MALFKLGKTKLPHKKSTKDMAPVRIAPPGEVILPMSQHIGAPAKPIVKAGDAVYVGTLVGESGGFVSVSIHSSVSGTVKRIESFLMSNGRTCDAVVIESDGQMTPDPEIKAPVVGSFEELSAAVRASGLAGLGGAGFPTSVKLDPSKISSIDTLVVNAAECEPYITSDTRTMIDEWEHVKSGIVRILDLSGIASAVIGIEANKPECIKILEKAFADDARVRIEVLKTTYPQGAEKILIYNTTGREVPEGGLPADVGVLILNVTTAAFISKYLDTGMPLVEKCVTVDGSAVNAPKNVIAPIGTPISYLLEAVGGAVSDPAKVLLGGPMMGVSVCSLEHPVMKNTNAVLAFSEEDARVPAPTACIHCGRCVSACPMGLDPTAFAKAMNIDLPSDRAERLKEEHIGLCMECGCCSFVCPAKRPLVENNRLAKADLRKFGTEGGAKK